MDAKSWIQEIRAAGKLMAAGDLAGAENRYRQLLDKGTDNPLHKALALDGLGRAVFEQGRQAEAIEAIEAAVSLLRERQGVQDPATCGALQNLGRLYLAAGQISPRLRSCQAISVLPRREHCLYLRAIACCPSGANIGPLRQLSFLYKKRGNAMRHFPVAVSCRPQKDVDG